jgi:hypothetical protein
VPKREQAAPPFVPRPGHDAESPGAQSVHWTSARTIPRGRAQPHCRVAGTAGTGGLSTISSTAASPGLCQQLRHDLSYRGIELVSGHYRGATPASFSSRAVTGLLIR